MMKRNVLGKAIKAIRLAQGHKASEFATECSISDGHLHNIERGIRTPNAEHLAAIAAALGVELDAISYVTETEVAA